MRSQTPTPKAKRPRTSYQSSRTAVKENSPALTLQTDAGPSNPFLPMFNYFRDELDEHHDCRERVIKASRDVTALSKKMIFSLQRSRQLAAPLPAHLEDETSNRLVEITNHLTAIAPDLQGLNSHRYQRQISGGLQELVEALCFKHYLTTGTLLLHAEAQKSLPGGIELTETDYVLGVFDFVGEVMRFGITMIALRGGEGDSPQRILLDLRRLREGFERLVITGNGGFGKEEEKKMVVMKTCVEKVENAVYGMIVRGSERPRGWVPDLDPNTILLSTSGRRGDVGGEVILEETDR